MTTAVATAEESTNFPIGGYTLVCCGEQLLCFGGWIPGAPAKPPAARPQTAPAGRTGNSGGAQRASNALHAFHLGEKRWRELAADTAVMPPPRPCIIVCVSMYRRFTRAMVTDYGLTR